MGRNSSIAKARTCKVCEQKMQATAAEIIDHAILCARMMKLGLTAPVRQLIVETRPKLEIIRLDS